MSEAVAIPPKMDADTYAAWVVNQPDNYELWDGEAVRAQSERNAHNLVKLRIAINFTNALDGHASGCTPYADGASVRVSDAFVFEPDASIGCGEVDLDSIFVADPVVVVEIISPSSATRDKSLKFEGYFAVPSVQHYLVVNTQGRTVVHHSRDGDEIRSRIMGSGTIALDPPGIELDVVSIFEDLQPRR